MKIKLPIYFFCLLFIVAACKKKGCTDSAAGNYSPEAEKDDGSCLYLPPPDPGPTTVDRISYGTNERQHFDLYLPGDHNANTKTVILVHGGAWVLGPQAQDSVTTFNGGLGWDLSKKLLDEGYAVAVMKYRLACYTTQPGTYTGDPNFYMDKMLEDIDLTIDKLKSDASTLDISASDFAIIGESAGAQMALLYALRNSSDPDLKTVISFYSPADMGDEDFKTGAGSFPYNNLPLSADFGAPMYGNSCEFTTTGSVNLLWGLKSLAGYNLANTNTNPEYTDTLSPSHLPNIQRNLPTFVMHGESDDLVPPSNADTLISRITSKFGTTAAASNDFTAQHKMTKYASCGHGWSGGSCSKAQMMQDVMSWLAEHL